MRILISIFVALNILINLADVCLVVPQLPAPNGQMNAISLYVMSLFYLLVDVTALWLVSYNADDPAAGNPNFTATKVSTVIFSAVSLVGNLSLTILNATSYERYDRDWRFVTFYWIVFGQFVVGTAILALAIMIKQPRPSPSPSPAATATTATTTTTGTNSGPTVVVNQVPYATAPATASRTPTASTLVVEEDSVAIKKRH
jgi:hypothetical protein